MRLVTFIDHYASLLFIIAFCQIVLTIFQIRYFIKVTDFIKELKLEINKVPAYEQNPAEQDPAKAAGTDGE